MIQLTDWTKVSCIRVMQMMMVMVRAREMGIKLIINQTIIVQIKVIHHLHHPHHHLSHNLHHSQVRIIRVQIAKTVRNLKTVKTKIRAEGLEVSHLSPRKDRSQVKVKIRNRRTRTN